MFTALNNGIVSAVLAFTRSFVFMIVCLLALPALLGVTGIWLANPAAELLAVILAAWMLMKYRKNTGTDKYGRAFSYSLSHKLSSKIHFLFLTFQIFPYRFPGFFYCLPTLFYIFFSNNKRTVSGISCRK